MIPSLVDKPMLCGGLLKVRLNSKKTFSQSGKRLFFAIYSYKSISQSELVFVSS